MENLKDELEEGLKEVEEFIDEKTIFLRKPVTIGGVTYDKLDLKEPEMHQVEKAALAQTEVGMAISLISQVAKVPLAVIKKLCQRDFKEAANFLGSISDDGQKTGETLSQS